MELKIGVLVYDCGDGSNKIVLFPSYEDAKAKWMNRNGWQLEDDIPEETTYYDHGTVSEETLEIVDDGNGGYQLATNYYFEGGNQ